MSKYMIMTTWGAVMLLDYPVGRTDAPQSQNLIKELLIKC